MTTYLEFDQFIDQFIPLNFKYVCNFHQCYEHLKDNELYFKYNIFYLCICEHCNAQNEANFINIDNHLSVTMKNLPYRITKKNHLSYTSNILQSEFNTEQINIINEKLKLNEYYLIKEYVLNNYIKYIDINIKNYNKIIQSKKFIKNLHIYYLNKYYVVLEELYTKFLNLKDDKYIKIVDIIENFQYEFKKIFLNINDILKQIDDKAINYFKNYKTDIDKQIIIRKNIKKDIQKNITEFKIINIDFNIKCDCCKINIIIFRENYYIRSYNEYIKELYIEVIKNQNIQCNYIIYNFFKNITV
jgi:hypothetical protein